MLAKFNTQIYNFETENNNCKIHINKFCFPEKKKRTDIIVCLEYC